MGAGVLAFSTMRQGGCSTGNYADFNINNYCGDALEHIARNRQALAALIGVSEQHIVMPHQTHGTVVCRVDAPPAEVLEGVDAVMTDVKGLCIGVSTADCIPILLYDAEHHAACAVHAGWRGTVKRIVQEAVRQMQAAYDSQPCQLKAVIGPGISLESFEVGDEVYQQFADAGFDMDPIARRYAKWHLDLPQCNRI
jgi:YfiH family protein